MISRQAVIDVLQERQNYYAERNESKQMFAIVNVIDDVLNIPSGNPWHTGTPPEEGWYLVALDLLPKGKGNIYRYETDYCNKKHKFNLFDSTVVAWQKITPYQREKKK